MLRLLPVLSSLVLLSACEDAAGTRQGGDEQAWDDPSGELVSGAGGTLCDPRMSVFPVGDVHNIGYDHASCGTGTCEVSCPDAHANSDWGGDHHGIDVFAYHRAPLVAVADGVVAAAGEPSSTSGLRIRIEDACGWHYYYGHMDEYVVSVGQTVRAGDLVGFMGATGTASTHLHFNISPWGDYDDDINPFDYLAWTSATACDGEVEEEPSGGGESTGGGESSGGGGESCGLMAGGGALWADEALFSCDGRFALVMQGDGNLALYQVGSSAALWSTGTHGNTGAWLAMQGDGNLVVYSAWGTALWHSQTHGHEGAVLAMQDDGNVVIYDDGWVLWSTGTAGH